MSQALYRKWRPARFDDVIGQEHIMTTLKNSVASERLGHAYLFCGPRGTGKTTSARLLAKALNCLDEDLAERPCNVCSVCKAVGEGRFLDLIEIDAASNTGVDDMRDLREKINFLPSEGRFKVYIIDEVHMLSTAAFNALLKTLEEPPPHVKFVLATTEEHKVPITIKSRCQQFNFRLLTTAEISGRLRWLAEKEDLTIEPEALALIARQGAGSVRDAESLMDQLITAPGDTITLDRTRAVLGTASETAVVGLTDAWLGNNGGEGLDIIHQALESGTDSRQFCRQMVAYLRELLLLQAAGGNLSIDGTVERKQAMLAQAERAPRQALIAVIKSFSAAALAPTVSWQPQLSLELAFIEQIMADNAPLAPVAAVRQPIVSEQRPLVKPQTAVVKQAPSVEKAAPVKKPAVANKPVSTPQPPIAPPPTELTAIAPSSEQPINLGMATAQWREMVLQAGKQDRNLPALLNMGKPLAIEGSCIVLGFDYPIFKERFSKKPEAAVYVGEIYSRLLGANCTVRAVNTSDYAVPVKREEIEALAKELGGVVKEEDLGGE